MKDKQIALLWLIIRILFIVYYIVMIFVTFYYIHSLIPTPYDNEEIIVQNKYIKKFKNRQNIYFIESKEKIIQVPEYMYELADVNDTIRLHRKREMLNVINKR